MTRAGSTTIPGTWPRAQAILTTAQPDRWEQERAIARKQARQAFGLDQIVTEWTQLLQSVTAELEPA